jgi:hypothetical protein
MVNKTISSLQDTLDLPLQHVPQTVLLLEQPDVVVYVFVGLGDCVGDTGFIHQVTVLALGFL